MIDKLDKAILLIKEFLIDGEPEIREKRLNISLIEFYIDCAVRHLYYARNEIKKSENIGSE